MEGGNAERSGEFSVGDQLIATSGLTYTTQQNYNDNWVKGGGCSLLLGGQGRWVQPGLTHTTQENYNGTGSKEVGAACGVGGCAQLLGSGEVCADGPREVDAARPQEIGAALLL